MVRGELQQPRSHLVIIHQLARVSSAGDELGHVEAVILQEHGHGGQEDGAHDNAKGADDEGPSLDIDNNC